MQLLDIALGIICNQIYQRTLGLRVQFVVAHLMRNTLQHALAVNTITCHSTTYALLQRCHNGQCGINLRIEARLKENSTLQMT